MPGLASFLMDTEGSVTERAIEHYRRRAAGGPAMVIMEACAVSADGIVSRTQARIDQDRYVAGLSKIASALKSEGAVPALQIHHAGRQTSSSVIKQMPKAPSNLPCPSIMQEVHPLTVEEIQNLVQQYADGAARARAAGFELIEIHGAHGYLINQFLSGFSNIRSDRYGRDLIGRTRFAREVVQAVRERLGDAVPLSFKISAQEFLPKGLKVADSIEILKILVAAGIDLVQVSAGNDGTPEWICQPMFMEPACLADSAAEIKQALNIPVMTVGRINSPLLANEIIEKGKADLVCVGRGLLADPEMPRKARAGRLDDIRSCIACNTCMESIFRIGRVECLVNPTLGRETEMTIEPASKPRKIMVIGGGPGGLNAAWVAAKRGHEVHIFDKNTVPGGQLVLGSIAGFKKDLLSLIQYLKKQTELFNVHYHPDCEVSIDTVKKEQPDAIILATGSIPLMPPIDGIQKEIVMPLQAALNGDQPILGKTIVVGGGPTGCEAALHLAEFCPVVLVEMLPEVGKRLETITRKMFVRRLKEKEVEILTGCQLVEIKDDGIFIIDSEGAQSFISARHLILTVGNQPDNHLYDKIAGLGYEVHKIGDCLKPRSAKEAIYESAVIARTI